MAAKTKIKFDDYVNMVRKAAWHFAKKFGMEYEDVEAQGFLIYCMSIEKYNKKKASFSTFLYRNLSGYLLEYCKTKTEKKRLDSSLEDFLKTDLFGDGINFDIFAARKSNPTIDELLHYAKNYLSSDAYKVLAWILDRQWESGGCKKPCIAHARQLFCGVRKWDMKRVCLAWNEIGDFWHSGLFTAILS